MMESGVKIFGPATLEACAMASIHFNNIQTGDFLNPILQKEVDAFRMLEGEFEVMSIEVEVKRSDGREVTSQMEIFGRSHFAKTFPLKLAEMVAVEKREDYWEVSQGGVWIFQSGLFVVFAFFIRCLCHCLLVGQTMHPNHSDKVRRGGVWIFDIYLVPSGKIATSDIG